MTPHRVLDVYEQVFHTYKLHHIYKQIAPVRCYSAYTAYSWLLVMLSKFITPRLHRYHGTVFPYDSPNPCSTMTYKFNLLSEQ